MPLVKAIMAEFRGAKIDSLTRRIAETEDGEAAPSFFEEEAAFNDEE